MKKFPGELVEGDVITSRRLGKVVVESVVLLPTGDYEIMYARANHDGYGFVVVLESAEFEVEK